MELGALHRVSAHLDCVQWSVLDAGMLLLKIDGVGVAHKGCTWKVDILLRLPRLYMGSLSLGNCIARVWQFDNLKPNSIF